MKWYNATIVSSIHLDDYPKEETSQCYPDHRTENHYWYTRLFKKNHILLNQTRIKSLKGTIRLQSKSMFYRSAQSRHKHIRELGRSFTHSALDRSKILPRPYTAKQSSHIVGRYIIYNANVMHL